MRSIDLVSTGGAGSPAGTAVATPVPPDSSPYWTFYEEVARRQVLAWTPATASRILDLSGPPARFATLLAEAGHEVVHACSRGDVLPTGGRVGGRLLPVLADGRALGWLAACSVDAVLAESRALSRCLATEVTVADLRRVLRPGGRLLLVVDSLGLGLARLAEQGRWAELADLPNAEVVLVPGAGGSITRCFHPAELVELLTAEGLAVDRVRSRTVLGPAAVERALEQGGPAALEPLTRSELDLAEKRGGDAPGLHLVVSARRPG